MFAKIVKGKDLSELETEVNKFLADHSLGIDQSDIESHENFNKEYPDVVLQDLEKRKLKIYNVQQFVIGEVDPKSVSIINQQPVPKFSFCLLLICGYE